MITSIEDRIQAALEKARWRKLELRGMYLDEEDYQELADSETENYRKSTGSSAKLWPCTYQHVLLLSRKAIPVHEAIVSAVYATSGERICIPKKLSPRVAA